MRTKIKTALLGLSAQILLTSFGMAGDTPANMVMDSQNGRLTIEAQPVTGLYDINELKTIYLQFSRTDWWQQLTANYSTKADLAADLTYEGVTYKNVGVRFRGQTSYQKVNNSQKKSFNISIDYLDSSQRLMGYKTLNLNNCFDDPSFMREALYTALAGKTIPAAKTNFVILVINGENWGVYSNVQQLNKEFYGEWFLSNDGTNWRAEYPDTSTAKPKPGQGGSPPGGGGNFGAGQCSLNYMSDTALVYSRYYTLKSTEMENPWEGLAKACYMLNKLPSDKLYDSLKYYLDVDRSLWHIANEIAFADDDGYVNKGGMDYYVYYDAETGRLQPIDYDGNSTFTTKNVNWPAFLKETDTKFPLINRLLANPELKQRYVAHMRAIFKNSMDETATGEWIDGAKSLIDAAVQADSKKLYSYSQFSSSVNELKTFIANRKKNLLNNPMIKAEPPVIESVALVSGQGNGKAPAPGDPAKIIATASSADGIKKVVLYYGTGLAGTFDKAGMTDEGGGIYGVLLPGYPAGTYVRYYVEAISANSYGTIAYSPEGAEHDVYFYLVGNEIEDYTPVVINELMASNSNTIADPQGEYDDWIELFNKSGADVNLTGMYLSDKVDNPKKWQFPDNTVLKAGEYLIVWADEDSKETPGVHTNFKLSAGGEVVMLINTDANGNTILDSVNFGALGEDISYGRLPNGVGSFTVMPPTPGAMNESNVSAGDELSAESQFRIVVTPNPACGDVNFSLEFPSEGVYRIGIYDIRGALVKDFGSFSRNKGTESYLWNSSEHNAAPGIYVIKVESPFGAVTGKIILVSNN